MRVKKKVLLLGPAYPYRGGIADTQNYLAQNLSRLGHEVLVYTFKYQYPKLLFPGKTQYSSVPMPKGIDIKRKIHSINPINWIKISNEINHYDPDIVLFRYWTPFLAPCWIWIAKRLSSKIKKIALVDNWIPHDKKPWDKTMNDLFGKTMDAFVTLSNAVVKEIMEDKPKTPIWSGFHPIADDLPKIISKAQARKKLGWSKEKNIVLFFGLIRKYKGLDLLIEAFSKSPLKSSKTLLAIVGEPYEKKEKYVSLIHQLKLEDRIICDFNYADRELTRDVICAADVVAQTYRSATQSGVTPLAYYYQTPLLVSNLPGLKAPIEKDGTGVVTEKKPEKIANNLYEILKENNLLYYQKNLSQTLKNYTWQHFCKSMLSFINSVHEG
ncbi:MAG: glycosyltransferase family 4 protein [Flavobacteriaceae bacterium]